jgi:hypothetical protein
MNIKMKKEKEIQLQLRDIDDKLADVVHQLDEVLRRLYRIEHKPNAQRPHEDTQIVGGPFDLGTL